MKKIEIYNERELCSKYIEFEKKIIDVYKITKKYNLNDNSLMRIIFWYEYSIGSCFYDSVLFCRKKSKWENIVQEYENGLELRINSFNWIKTLKEKNQVIYDKFYVLYKYIYEFEQLDNSGEQDNDDVFIIGCSEIDDHVKKCWKILMNIVETLIWL